MALPAPPTPAGPAPPASVEEAMAVPPGLRAGSLAAVTAQRDALLAYVKANTHAPFDPVACGLLEPKTAQARKRVRDKTRIEESEGGDSSLRRLAEKATAKLEAKAAHAAAVLQRKDERAEKKARLEASEAANLAAYQACTPMCTCGGSPCPWVGMHYCPHSLQEPEAVQVPRAGVSPGGTAPRTHYGTTGTHAAG